MNQASAVVLCDCTQSTILLGSGYARLRAHSHPEVNRVRSYIPGPPNTYQTDIRGSPKIITYLLQDG